MGNLDTVDEDLTKLISIQKQLKLPEGVVTHTKVKRAKMKIFQNKNEVRRLANLILLWILGTIGVACSRHDLKL